MKKYFVLLILCFLTTTLFAQRLLSWSPEFPLDNSTLTITVDCNKGNQGLLNFEAGNSANIYVHVGVITNLSTSPTDWKYTKFTWGTADAAAHATALGGNKYSYTISNIRSFFGVPAGETIKKVTCIFRNADGSKKQVNSDGSDMYIPVYGATEYAVRLNLPASEPRYMPWLEPINVAVNGTVPVTGVASANSNLTLNLNGTVLNTASNAATVSATATITASCAQEIRIAGVNGAQTSGDTARFFVAPTTVTAALPAGVQEGINYDANNTSVTLVLYAPNKNNVVVIGDFSNWAVQCSNQMNRTPDGNYYWITINGLTPGTEYGYQYVIDNSIKTADPYAQKILDPNNDSFIDAVTYPNLKPYPTGLTTDMVSVFQTAEPQYNWQVNTFSKPDKKNLVIYELLVRDFTAQHSYQALIDSFSYFKNLGINAIELMPINEFDGNESWGYNPDFYFAADKYYGTKNKLKEFIDKCHQNGIAVILDVVYNHCTGNAPQAKMYWDAVNNRPAANNPWLNIAAPHPYSVFNDFNHTSSATQYLVKRSLNFWAQEYKVDGFRLDLAKGFTQTVTNTTTVENYDASRVANLKRYYDTVIQNMPSEYMILEFLGSTPSQEEQEYAAYGWMLWGNSNPTYNQCTMGYTDNSDIRAMVYNSPLRNFNNPAVIGYSESHDEERTMFKNLQYGNAAGSYNVKNLPTALRQEEAAASVIFTIPGPKMVWQFQERGYDSSINANGGRLANKPPLWHYMNDVNRRVLYNAYGKMIQFRLANPGVFSSSSFTYDFNNGLYKVFQIADPAAAGLKVTVVSNMDVSPQSKTITFQPGSDWTNYLSNGTGTGLNAATGTNFTITTSSQTITLQPGEYHIYVSTPPCTTSAPVVTTPLNYCQNATATALTATGTNLLWYTAATGGTGSATAPKPVTTAAGSTTYYVSQATTCESPRTAIVVNITATPAAPTVTTPVNYCQNATASVLTATGTNLLWYTSATGGTGSATAPIPPTISTGNTIYYVSQSTGSCEGPRNTITVTVTSTTAAPSVASPVNYCQNATATPLTATGTNLLWYTSASGGTGSATAPVPVTTTATSTIFYVSQTQACGESPRASIVINVSALSAAPTVTSPINYCQNATATALTAAGTNLLWYTSASGGTGSVAAPVPVTTTAGNSTYFVSQSPGACESPRTSINVNITALPSAPVVNSPVAYCLNATASALTATGTNLLWYTSATGGVGSSAAPVPATTVNGTTIYYVSQTPAACESPRAAITINVTTIPAAPVVNTPVIYCVGTAATALTATGNNLVWYTTATGGTASASAPLPATTTVATTIYYVTQSNSCGESNRAGITINVNAPAPATGLNAAPVATNTATLNWSATAGLFYTIEYKATVSPAWIIAIAGTTSSAVTINNLIPGTLYDWRVSSNCSSAAGANYILSQFTTSLRNTGMTNLKDGFGIKISPNPVGSAAIVDYIVPGNGTVSLSLFNVNGKLLQQLFNAQQSAGQYQLNIKTQFNNLPAGIYFIRLRQNGKGNFINFIKK